MRIVILTSNSLRHKFIANELSKNSSDVLVISECKENDSNLSQKYESELIQNHFQKRFLTEQDFFTGNDFFKTPTLPILYKELSLPYLENTIKIFKPDVGFVFGSSLLTDKIINCFPKHRLINLHLGLSPYYRGAGTNFWPFVNNELEFVGSTILHLNSGVDTGNIIGHIRPDFSTNDNVHTAGCKVIQKSLDALSHIVKMIENEKKLNSIKQWSIPNSKYYKQKDFNEKSLKQYYENIDNNIVKNYIETKKLIKLIEVDDSFDTFT